SINKSIISKLFTYLKSQVNKGKECVVSLNFFFSSRRRHTRSYGDWSSDVCSSDLFGLRRLDRCDTGSEEQGNDRERTGQRHELRSEERRVGKECRSWWWR